jgi:hypothetical protein
VLTETDPTWPRAGRVRLARVVLPQPIGRVSTRYRDPADGAGVDGTFELRRPVILSGFSRARAHGGGGHAGGICGKCSE